VTAALWFGLAAKNAEAARVLRLVGQGDVRWSGLYHVLEVVLDDDAAGQIYTEGWATRTEIRLFKQTANSPGAIGDAARHGHDSVRSLRTPSWPRLLASPDTGQVRRRHISRTVSGGADQVFSPRHFYGTSRPIDALGIVCDAGFPGEFGCRFPRVAFWRPEVKWHERDVVVPAFRQWLEAQGWETETETEFVDVVAHRGNETIYAEVKGRTKGRPGAGLDTLYGQLLRRMPAEEDPTRRLRS
jgi:hypothetical protein